MKAVILLALLTAPVLGQSDVYIGTGGDRLLVTDGLPTTQISASASWVGMADLLCIEGGPGIVVERTDSCFVIRLEDPKEGRPTLLEWWFMGLLLCGATVIAAVGIFMDGPQKC